MEIALILDRLQFAFTVIYHYLFPQLTMGLALLIVVLKTRALATGDERLSESARFWAKLFGINFTFGVITGIPMEFQFGTNWAAFSNFAGGVIGQTLAMEGVFAFFLESTFLGLFLFAEKRLGPRLHWLMALLVFVGSWASGYFIIATNAWMQHPVAFSQAAGGAVHLTSFWGLLGNSWILWQYLHNMTAAVVTGAFVMAALGAYYLLSGRHQEHAKTFVRIGVITAAVASILLLFPTGDGESQQVFANQPEKGAAMEGLFSTEQGAKLIIIGQPNMETLTLDNPIAIPKFLSFLTYRHLNAEVKGLTAFPTQDWPDNVPLVYYAYHIMVGLGTIFIVVMLLSLLYLWRRRLFKTRWLLWILMFSAPFPYIATTAGWVTAEVGRQPWLVYGLMRTSDGASPLVSSGNGLFTLLGFVGMYFIMGLLFLFLVLEIIHRGPERVEGVRGE